MDPAEAWRCELDHVRRISMMPRLAAGVTLWGTRLIALRRIDKGLVVVIVSRKFVHVGRQFAERHDPGRCVGMVLRWQRSQGGGCCGDRKQSDGYDAGDRSMLRHGKPPFPRPTTVRQGNGSVVQRQTQLIEAQDGRWKLRVT